MFGWPCAEAIRNAAKPEQGEREREKSCLTKSILAIKTKGERTHAHKFNSSISVEYGFDDNTFNRQTTDYDTPYKVKNNKYSKWAPK